LVEIGLPTDACDALEQARELASEQNALAPLLHDLAIALLLSGRWHKASVALDELHAVERAADPLADRHSDSELTLFEARWRTDADLPTLLAEVEGCAVGANAGIEHRLRAASMALVFADNLCDEAAARRLHLLVSSLPERWRADRRAALHCDIVFHSVYGDLDVAIEAGRQLIALEREDGSPIQLARALRHAAMPLRYSGEHDAAVLQLVEAYQLATRYRLASAARNAADTLATLNLHIGDLDAAETWLERGCEWLESAEESVAQTSLARVRMRIAIARHDRADPSDSDLRLDDPVTRRCLEASALWALCGSGLPTDTVYVERFWRLYLKGRHLGGQDLSTAGFVHLYRRSGKGAAAQALLNQYLQVRRERGPLSAELIAIADDLLA
jgi:hypothetical protein